VSPTVLLVCRFAVARDQVPTFLTRARRALQLLSDSGGLGGELGRAVDDRDRWVLVVRFPSVVAYRRALSRYAVREHVVPLLSEALADEPSTYETLADVTGGKVGSHVSLLAAEEPTAR